MTLSPPPFDGLLRGRTGGLTSACLSVLVSASLLGLLVPQHGGAQDTPPDGTWEFVVAPYLSLPHMNGELTVRRVSVGLDVGPGAIFEALNFAAMLYLEATNRTWTITFDGLYGDIEGDGTTRITSQDARANVRQLAAEVTGMRRIVAWAEVGIGGRVNSIEGGLLVEPGEILPGFDVREQRTWFDPLVVARFSTSIKSNWRLGLKGDVGGFGIGSDFAWQVFPHLGYRFGDLFELSGGYRVTGMKYEDGSGDDLFVYDMILFGPQFGFGFHF